MMRGRTPISATTHGSLTLAARHDRGPTRPWACGGWSPGGGNEADHAPRDRAPGAPMRGVL
eukprot:15459801-Alexandrium_andersonii.AAC.1